MDLRQLSYFLSLFEEGSTTRAARRMNVVQPALSMQISKLEDELGQKLFERTSHGMIPTSSGHLAYRLFAPILRDLSDAKQQLAQRSGEVSGRISVGLIASVTTSVLARCLRKFSDAYPQVEVAASEGYSSALVESVRGGTLDFALINKTRQRLDLPSIDVLDEEMVLVTSANGKLDRGAPVMFRDLAALPLILPSTRHGLRMNVERIAENENVNLSVRLEVDSVAAVEELVRNSNWATILPAIAVHRGLSDGSLKAYQIVAPRITRQIVCVHNPRRPLPEAARLFIEILTAELVATAEILHADKTHQHDC